MTRKEERIEASIDYQMSINPMALGGAAYEDMIRKMNVNHSFIAGAEWADKSMLDKVYKWLDKYMCNKSNGIKVKDYQSVGELIYNLRKAMEE